MNLCCFQHVWLQFNKFYRYLDAFWFYKETKLLSLTDVNHFGTLSNSRYIHGVKIKVNKYTLHIQHIYFICFQQLLSNNNLVSKIFHKKHSNKTIYLLSQSFLRRTNLLKILVLSQRYNCQWNVSFPRLSTFRWIYFHIPIV